MICEDECLRQIEEVREAIDDVESNYLATGVVGHEAAHQFRLRALGLLYDWERAPENTQLFGGE